MSWQRLGANDPDAAEAFWNDLSPQEQAEVSALLEDVVFEDWTFQEPSISAMANCNDIIGHRAFYWAGGTIYGGNVTQSIRWCWDSSSYGEVTFRTCYPDHDQLWPWAFNGWVRSCSVTSGGLGQQHVAYQTEGIFISTHNTSAYPCAGTTVDGYGNASNWDC